MKELSLWLKKRQAELMYIIMSTTFVTYCRRIYGIIEIPPSSNSLVPLNTPG